MPRRRPDDLAPFLAELERRLDALDDGALRDVLRAHARELSRSERVEFLRLFPAAGRDGVRRAPRSDKPRVAHEKLLDDIESFLERIESGELEPAWRPQRRSWSRDDDEHEPDDWAIEMTALFQRADRAFLDGAREVAAAAYDRLLGAFEDEEGIGRFYWIEMPEHEVDCDLEEVRARHARCIVDTHPPREAAEQLRDHLAATGLLARSMVSLQALFDADPSAVPDRDAFLAAWQDVLERRPLPADSEWDDAGPRLLREVALLRGGPDALGEVARAGRDARAFAEWSDALLEAGDADGALAAAREGMRRVPAGRGRAALGDRVAALRERSGDSKAALVAARKAWRDEPTLTRLLRLLDVGAPDAAAVVRRARTELGVAAELDAEASLRAAVEAIAADHAAVVRRLGTLTPLGWSAGTHAGSLLVPFALVAGGCPDGPPPGSLLAASWDAIGARAAWRENLDALIEAEDGLAEDPDGPDGLDGADGANGADGADGADGAAAVAPSPGVRRDGGGDRGERLRAHLAESARRIPQKRRTTLLRAAVRASEERAEAIAEGKHRGAYERAARVLVASAEAHALAGDAKRARAIVDRMRERHRRKWALRAEIDAACAASSVLAAAPEGR